MLPKIRDVQAMDGYILRVAFDDGHVCRYDVSEDMKALPGYEDLAHIPGLFRQVQLDQSRTCVYWNEYIDLPSDTLYEYGVPV